MKVKAAVLNDVKTPFEMTELDLDGPGPGEVLIRYVAAGLWRRRLLQHDDPPRAVVAGGDGRLVGRAAAADDDHVAFLPRRR